MTRKPKSPTGAEWACFRFSVVGQLLSDPPAQGELKTAIRALAERTWHHPVSECNVQFAAATIERWYYIARREEDDPVRACAPPCAKTAAKFPSPRHWPSGSISDIATTRTGATNCTTTISPR